jgi:hypothetical protein
MEEFKNEIIETMNKAQQESQARIDTLQQVLEQMIKMNMGNNVNTATASPVVTVAEQQPVRRNLLAHLATPLTAVRRNTQAASTAVHQSPLGAAVTAAPTPAEEIIISAETRKELQKGLAKPPVFTGDMDEKSEPVSTWWRQVYNYASAFDTSVQATMIKSYLRGSAAAWLESREKEKNRDLTLEELAHGLAQEYGSEITSKAALQKIETLSMGRPECSTLSKYNAAFNKQYNLLSSADQVFAPRAYMKGLLPTLQKLIRNKNLPLETLSEVRSAATEADAEQDAIDLAFKQFRLITNKSDTNTHRQKNYTTSTSTSTASSNSQQPYRGRRWENSDAFKVNLSSISDNLHDDEETGSGNEERPEGQVAAMQANDQNNRPRGSAERKGIRLNDEDKAVIKQFNLCWRCFQPGHIKRDCRSPPATERPKPLKDQAPSRK